MAKERPIIFILQGGIMAVEAYVPLHQALSELGYVVIHPVYPTLYAPDPAEKASKSILDDAANVRSAISRLVEGAGQEVFVVCHSYGGLVSSEAITEPLTAKWRRAKGLPGGVVHLYMISAAVVEKGTLFPKEALTNQVGYIESHDGQSWTVENNEAVFYNDSTPAEGKFWTSLHRWMAMKTLASPLTNEGWRYVDATYLITTNDGVWPVDGQRNIAASIEAKVEEIHTGHSPWLTQAKEVAKRIDAVAQRATEHAL